MRVSTIAFAGSMILSCASASSLDAQAIAAEPERLAKKTIAIDHAALGLAPYVWKLTGKSTSAAAEAAMPGAYMKAAFHGSTTVGLILNGSINRGCPASSMPVVEFSIDEGPFKAMPLSRTEES